MNIIIASGGAPVGGLGGSPSALALCLASEEGIQ